MNLSFISFSSVDSFLPNGLYNCQVNPDKFSVGTKDIYAKSPDTSATNQHIESSKPLYSLKTWDLSFVIDNTGVLEFPPMGFPPIVIPGTSIYPSISYFKGLFLDNEDDTHTRNYIKGIWGMGSITIFGRVKKFDYTYDFFDNLGVPLRATLSMTIEEVPLDGMLASFRSPDITRIPKVKDGDTLVEMCNKNYDNKKYYIKVAEVNNLSSFRKLKAGRNLVFPPIDK